MNEWMDEWPTANNWHHQSFAAFFAFCATHFGPESIKSLEARYVPHHKLINIVLCSHWSNHRCIPLAIHWTLWSTR